jgi:pyroglutamyl-peptidase
MSKILLTGFEPWGEWTINPSGEVASSLDGHKIGGVSIVTGIVPVVHGEDIETVRPLIEQHDPVAVVSIGLGGSSGLNVERVAVNIKEIDSDEGTIDLPVVEGGPDAYLSTLPTRDMVEYIRSQGVPTQLSYSAGTFLCNHLMYSVLHHLRASERDVISGFIHIPPMPEQVVGSGRPSMSLDTVRQGVVAALECVEDHIRHSASV